MFPMAPQARALSPTHSHPPPVQAAGGDANIAAELFLETGGDVAAAGGVPLPGGAATSLDRDEALARSLAAMVGGVDE